MNRRAFIASLLAAPLAWLGIRLGLGTRSEPEATIFGDLSEGTRRDAPDMTISYTNHARDDEPFMLAQGIDENGVIVWEHKHYIDGREYRRSGSGDWEPVRSIRFSTGTWEDVGTMHSTLDPLRR